MRYVYPEGSTYADKRRYDAGRAIRRYLETAMLSDSHEAHDHLQALQDAVLIELDAAAELMERSTEDLDTL